MRKFAVVFLLSLLPTLADAALLRYEIEFTPWQWPSEIEVYPNGTGYIIANTEFNTIIGGELKANEFHFLWTNTTFEPMSFLDTYYDWHVVRAGGGWGVDAMSGVEGSLDLMFLLPPGLDNYSAGLDQHFAEDIWSELSFPGEGRPADQWEHYYLGLNFNIFPPTVISDVSVSEPSAFTLLSLGLIAVGAVRLRRRAGSVSASGPPSQKS
ncbi:MAG: hypothetical protein MH219_00110 [Marinobacter sp.]|jgi:hypothetical protein|nr:hypothetical protein [Marinobacter sp.]